MTEKLDGNKRQTTISRFLRNPQQVGAVMESSSRVVEKVLEAIPKGAKKVIEIGPGNGVATREILKKLAPDGTLLVIESDSAFAAQLNAMAEVDAKIHSRSRLKVIHGTVQDVISGPLKAKYHDALSALSYADAIVASAPFSTRFSPNERENFLAAAHSLLAPNAKCVVFHQYRGVMSNPMHSIFGNVKKDKVLWPLPPCRIFTSVRQALLTNDKVEHLKKSLSASPAAITPFLTALEHHFSRDFKADAPSVQTLFSICTQYLFGEKRMDVQEIVTKRTPEGAMMRTPDGKAVQVLPGLLGGHIAGNEVLERRGTSEYALTPTMEVLKLYKESFPRVAEAVRQDSSDNAGPRIWNEALAKINGEKR